MLFSCSIIKETNMSTWFEVKVTLFHNQSELMKIKSNQIRSSQTLKEIISYNSLKSYEIDKYCLNEKLTVCEEFKNRIEFCFEYKNTIPIGIFRYFEDEGFKVLACCDDLDGAYACIFTYGEVVDVPSWRQHKLLNQHTTN